MPNIPVKWRLKEIVWKNCGLVWTAIRWKCIRNQVVFSPVHAMGIPMLMLRVMICHLLTIAPSVDTYLSSRTHWGSTFLNDYGHKLHWYYSETSAYLKNSLKVLPNENINSMKVLSVFYLSTLHNIHVFLHF